MKRITILLLMVFLLPISWCSAAPTEKWVDMAKSHTGQVIPVNRTVEYHFGRGSLESAWKRWPNTFSLEFTNPFDGQKISWQGEEYVHPVLLDVVNGSAWLVITSSEVYSNVKKYGCPEIPYVFLNYSSKTGWRPVEPSGAPPELKEANLWYDYQPYLLPPTRIVDADQIASDTRSAEVSSSGRLSRIIPRNLEEWKYKYKKSGATTRVRNDCRPPLEQPVDYIAAAGPSRNVELEVLATEVIEPELVVQNDPSAWGAYTWDRERALACADRLGPAADEGQDQRLVAWRRFVHDTTGKRLFPNSYSRFCDFDAVWIMGHRMTESGRVVIAKTTNTGDILYKISFKRPAVSVGSDGEMRISTFHARDGFVYFDWVNYYRRGPELRVKHLTKFRFPEPGNLPPRP